MRRSLDRTGRSMPSEGTRMRTGCEGRSSRTVGTGRLLGPDNELGREKGSQAQPATRKPTAKTMAEARQPRVTAYARDQSAPRSRASRGAGRVAQHYASRGQRASLEEAQPARLQAAPEQRLPGAQDDRRHSDAVLVEE